MQSKSFRYLVIILAVAIFSNLAYGIRINEIESNPEGSDSGKEWVELYSETETNISLYGIKNGDNSTLNLTDFYPANFSFSGYLLINLSSQWLDNTDEIIFLIFNGSIINETGFLNDSADDNRSWSYCNGNWIFGNSTPGRANICSSQQSCVQNWSCTGWGSCTSGSQTRTCTDLSNCSNLTGKPSESQGCTSGVSVDLDYDNEVTNGEEFEVKVDIDNLKDEEYDLKVFIYTDNPNDPISEIYNDADEKWQSGYNYLMNVIEGSGDKEITFKLRIDSDEDSFSGDANISVKVRDDAGNVVANMTDDITIAEMEESEEEDSVDSDEEDEPPASASTTNTANSDSSDITGGVIKLGSKQENIKTSGSKVLYKSDTEYFKEYGLYGLAFICVIAIVGFLIKPNQNGKNKKHSNT